MAQEMASFGAAQEYWTDACQRGLLFLDTLREPGNIYHEHASQEIPHVLSFPVELVRDGRALERPVNYGLTRIVPPTGVTVDPAKPPIIVVDPRAGHGPGIGGMKPDSEIGVALAAGHPCYFIAFSPKPMPGQTIEDVCRAEAVFVEEVAARHPEAEGKPIIIANCQAGWQIMMMAATRPDLAGPIMLAGTPLSYWAGVRGKNPMRYLGGALGGAWLTALAGDLGAGIFDGANLVANFESLNPANTHWTKAYNVANGQTIVYTLHHTIGHLGIFVSGKVATKEHREFVSCMEMIDLMPPGLYEATITEVDEDTENRDLVDGKYLFRLEARTLDDIRAFGVNAPEDDKRFEAVARLSEVNLGLYRTLAEPWIRASVTEPMAEAMRAMHPHRLRFGVFSDQDPFMRAIKPLAERVRANRKPVKADNPLLAIEKAASSWITTWLQSWGDVRDSMTEALFLNTYGSPLLQAMVGLSAQPGAPPRRIERDLAREAEAAKLRSELDHRFDEGGLEEALLRSLIYVRLPAGAADERGFRMLKAIRESRNANERLSLPRFKEMMREQFQLLLLDEERAINALPKLVKAGDAESATALDTLRRVIAAPGPLDLDGKRRLARVEALLGERIPLGRRGKAASV